MKRSRASAAQIVSRTRRQPERELHTAVAQYLDLALPGDAIWFPVPNASKRGKIQAANMKRAGEFRAGIPDIILVYRTRVVGIELKVSKGVLSPAQEDIHHRLTLAGAVVAVIRSLDDLYNFLSLIVPLKVRP